MDADKEEFLFVGENAASKDFSLFTSSAWNSSGP